MEQNKSGNSVHGLLRRQEQIGIDVGFLLSAIGIRPIVSNAAILSGIAALHKEASDVMEGLHCLNGHNSQIHVVMHTNNTIFLVSPVGSFCHGILLILLLSIDI